MNERHKTKTPTRSLRREPGDRGAGRPSTRTPAFLGFATREVDAGQSIGAHCVETVAVLCRLWICDAKLSQLRRIKPAKNAQVRPADSSRPTRERMRAARLFSSLAAAIARGSVGLGFHTSSGGQQLASRVNEFYEQAGVTGAAQLRYRLYARESVNTSLATCSLRAGPPRRSRASPPACRSRRTRAFAIEARLGRHRRSRLGDGRMFEIRGRSLGIRRPRIRKSPNHGQPRIGGGAVDGFHPAGPVERMQAPPRPRWSRQDAPT
jgi:hypothetical protein